MDYCYKIDDTVLYGAEGVCRITDICEKDICGRPVEYYVLTPIGKRNATVYVPVDNETLCAKMRQVLEKEGVDELIRSMPALKFNWVEEEGLRKKAYKEILASGDRSKIVAAIQALHNHQQKVKAKGRKMHVCDERFMKDAERIIYDEFAHVLQITSEEVPEYIKKVLDK